MREREQSLVGEGLTHGFSDVLGADTEEVQQLGGLSAAGDTRHGQSVHDDAGLCTDS